MLSATEKQCLWSDAQILEAALVGQDPKVYEVQVEEPCHSLLLLTSISLCNDVMIGERLDDSLEFVCGVGELPRLR